MTTTLRPTEPLQCAPDGGLSRRYQVCVNSRPVGAVHLATDPECGPQVAVVSELHIARGERGRGRGAIAALAAEEVARAWGCTRIETSVTAGSDAALGLAAALGYRERSRSMDKPLGGTPPALTEGRTGSTHRPMTPAEYAAWYEHRNREYTRSLIDRGVPEAAARAKSASHHARYLPDGLATADMYFAVRVHRGDPVGTLWVSLRERTALVLSVDVDEAHRGQGHGRALMRRAERAATDGGCDRISLHVFPGNTPALRLYASLGYRPTTYHVSKQLA